MSGLVDRESLLERVDDDLEFLEEIVELLETEGRELVEALRAACEAGDAEALSQKAHALKGMVSNFCAESVRSAAEEIEQRARAGALEGLTENVTGFEAAFERLCVETRAIAAGGSS